MSDKKVREGAPKGKEHLVDEESALYVREGRIAAYVKPGKLVSTERFRADLQTLLQLEQAPRDEGRRVMGELMSVDKVMASIRFWLSLNEKERAVLEAARDVAEKGYLTEDFRDAIEALDAAEKGGVQ